MKPAFVWYASKRVIDEAPSETAMPPKLAEHEQLTVEEFLAFTEERPDNERWELIEGVAVLNASPTYWHQIIATNISSLLLATRRARKATWRPLQGIGTRVPASPRSLPQPDVMVMERSAGDSAVADEALVLFEILSRSNTRTDQAWRRRVYSSVPNCQHYVVVDQYRPLIIRYDRASGWDKVEYTHLSDTLELPALSAVLSLAEIYDGVDVAGTQGA